MNKFLKFSIINLILCCVSLPLSAQLINQNSVNTAATDSQNSQDSAPSVSDEDKEDLGITDEEEKAIIDRLKKQLNPRMEDGNLVLNPVDLGKTGDGSPRGTAAFISTDSEKGTEDGNIFLFYSNFKISRTAATGLGCRVRFHILNGLNNRVSNISVKLVWPGLNTPVSFNNVNPNTENYFDYALFGEGCYNMDKIPNIVVNRCRVRGMSQEACANRIRWLTKR